jgi:hypothetical protein
MSSQAVIDNVIVTEMKEKKPRKPRAPKTVATEPVVAPTTEVVSELVAEPIVTVAESEPSVSSEKKKREPGLPAKFGKFLQFGFYLAESLKDTEGNFTINSYDDFINKMCIFDTVDNQQNFVQKFFDQSKDINKSIKKLVANKKKADAKAAKLANKPPKKNNKKNNTTSDITAVTETETNTETNTDNFVSEVVSLANPKSKPKPKRKYNKKTPSIDNNDNDNDNDNDNNNNNTTDELDVEIINIDGNNYLIDDNKRVFDFNNHNLIGSIDHNNLLVLY